LRACSTAAGDNTVSIGNVSMQLSEPKNPELVPVGYYRQGMPRELLANLRWMMQKDLLGQDIFLVGPPGPHRRQLALAYCELTKREVEILTISRDTTESDLKQRREIVQGNSVFVDQGPVRAALEGRLLILDGLEKAERNVLPTLNNLLENREMALDDGRFLMAPETYASLLESGYTEETLQQRKLVKVHPNFRVVALGLPIPPYLGHALDPPLRSRFQARSVLDLSPGALMEELMAQAPDVPQSTLQLLVNLAETFRTLEDQADKLGPRIPHFPVHGSLPAIARQLQLFPAMQNDVGQLVARAYPWASTLELAGDGQHQETARLVLDKMGLSSWGPKALSLPSSANRTAYSLVEAAGWEGGTANHAAGAEPPASDPNTINLVFAEGQGNVTAKVMVGGRSPTLDVLDEYVQTPACSQALTSILMDHAVDRDICIIGEKGSGKSALVRSVSHTLGYAVELFSLYKDMTARDLFQRRATGPSGETYWQDSPLVRAAKLGRLCVLDGIDRLSPDTLSVLQRLLHERELELIDGSRMLRASTYSMLGAGGALPSSDGAVTQQVGHVLPVHPSFRMIALAAPPNPTHRWLNAETVGMFAYHYLPTLASTELEQLLSTLYPQAPLESVRSLVDLAAKLETAQSSASKDDGTGVEGLGAGSGQPLLLSVRQLVRMCRRLNAYPEDGPLQLHAQVHNTLLTQFMPNVSRDAVTNLMMAAGIRVPESAEDADFYFSGGSGSTGGAAALEVKMLENNTQVSIGGVLVPVGTPERPELVPQPLFYDIPQHVEVLREMAQDILAGEKHLLLIGNQGVGKNKLADRMLQLLKREREYVQLHRDTTVQSLTLVPSLVNGVVVYEDSPLVRAVTQGRTLMVDEADKAPLEVVTILKGLVEDGEMLLADGRRILDPKRIALEPWHEAESTIPIHPDFSMWVLANRPGFPFLGNDFFRESGDIFASHTIDNPDAASEVSLLASYAPDVPPAVLDKLANSFAELRMLVEDGLLVRDESQENFVLRE
jgi:MoxR-like ATPase